MVEIDREDLREADRVSRDRVKEGERYIFEWSPYSWALDEQGLDGLVAVTVTDTGGIVRDIVMETDGGVTLRDLGEGRAQVMGPADRIDGVPDRTDVGRGGRYYALDPETSETRGTRASDMDTTGVLPGGAAERVIGGNY